MDHRSYQDYAGASPSQRFIRRAVSTSGGFASPPIISRHSSNNVSLSAEKPTRIPMQSIRRQNSIDRARQKEESNALLIGDNQCIFQVHNNSISPIYIEHEKNIMLNSHCGYVHCCLSRLEIIYWHGGRCTDRDIALTSRLSECLSVVESHKRQMNISSRRFRSVADFCKKLSLYPSSVTIDEIPPHVASSRIHVYNFQDTASGFHALHQAIKPPLSPTILDHSHITVIIHRKFVWMWVGQCPSAALLVRPALTALPPLLAKLERSDAKVLIVRHHSEPVPFQCLFEHVSVESLVLRCKGGERLVSVTESSYNEEESRDSIATSDIHFPAPPPVPVADLDPADPVLMTVAQKRVLYMQRAQSLGGVASGATSRNKKSSVDDVTTSKSADMITKQNADSTVAKKFSSHPHNDATLPTLGEDEAEDSLSVSEKQHSMADPMESSISAASDESSVDGVIVSDVRADSEEETSVVTDSAVMLVENTDASLVDAFFAQDRDGDTEKDEETTEMDTQGDKRNSTTKKFIPELAISTSTVGEHEFRELKHMESLAVHRKSIPRKSEVRQQEPVGMGCRCSIM